MLKAIVVTLTSLFLAANSSDNLLLRINQQNTADARNGVLEKLIVADGSVSMDLDLNRLNGLKSRQQMTNLSFGVAPNSFFRILVFNGELRGPETGTMTLLPQNSANLPAVLDASLNQLVIESTDWGTPFDLIVRDGKTGFVFFNVEGHQFEYDAKSQMFSVKEGRLLLSKDFAAKLGRSDKAGIVVGQLSISATMRPIEITQVLNGEAKSAEMPAGVNPAQPNLVGGPDVIVGDLSGLQQFGSSGTQVGLAVATDSCNAGAEPLHWFALPQNDHPVIPQNLYRQSGGASNNDRFEQIGRSWLKHAFTALQDNICGFGCNATASTTLGAGCSDPYSASLNAGSSNNNLGSRAWVNPFTGFYPGSSPNPRDHTGHTHTGVSHRLLVEQSDLNTTLNPGATYFAEAQYVTPHEYAWCQANPTQCNMYNNVSFRQFSVSGTTSFSFGAVGTTERTKPAISAWNGATTVQIQPDPGNDGIGFVAYKVTQTSPGVWHYEYAVYNENLDRGIQSFSVPVANGLVLGNVGFHQPPQHPAWANDGTVGSTGYSTAAWTPVQTSSAMSWSSETFAVNPNGNAILWGTLYNFRFDSDRAPQNSNATVGFFKTGAPIVVPIQGPAANPTITITDVSVSEGNSGTKLATFNVNLSATSVDPISVQYATANGSAFSGSDYVAASGTLNFTAGQTTQPVSITINGDTLEETNETYFVNLTNPVNAVIGDGQGLGTITNDDAPQATLPSGFGETQINGLSNPTAFALHPDGRIFVCEQGGTLRVIKNDVVQGTPFTTLTVNSSGERGLLGVAFDPNYASNKFVYVYYTATTPAIHNRVSRFTAQAGNEDLAVVGSETVLMDIDNLSGATNHNGGAIHFGADGKLYVAVGENANSANAQSLGNRLGKMLRINSDGSIPGDNPTTFPNIAGSTTGLNQAIWAVGLRNPFTFDFQTGTGRLHINDVGQNTWEEINNGIVGSNYGWGTCEGTCGVAGMTNPIYQYSSATASECAITGGTFYNPTTSTFPAQYVGKYFFADLCAGWIKTIDPLSPPATGTATDFLTGVNTPVDMHVANDGSLYYLARGTNSIFRVQYFGGSTVAINDVTVNEGNAGTSTANFTVTLSPASAQTVTVQYATANNTAFSGTDYVAASGTVTFTPGQTSQPVSVTINGDTQFESTENFNVNLTLPVNATIGDAQGVGTITNDDSQPTISINDVSVTEGNSGTTTATFTVSLSNTSSQTVSVNYATANDTASSSSDYVATSGTATITPGLLTTTVNVTVNGDLTVEPNETFFVNLTTPANGTISDSQGVGTINNDDISASPTISINDVSIAEGNSGTSSASFTVSLSASSSQTITVNYATADNSATAPGDYTATSGQLTFTPGQTTQPVSVTIKGDTDFEANETYFVNLSSAVNATISDGQGQGTITNDDTQPTISINDVSVTEGNAGTTQASFTVSLSNLSSQTITVNYATSAGTATAGTDYVTTSGTVTINPGTSSQPVNVTVNGDLLNEANETFNVNLTTPSNATISDNLGVGTINNDDAQPNLSINDVSVTEGNAGTTTASFTVSLSTASGQAVSVNYATANGTATSGSDYVAASSTVNFTAGQTSQPVSITVNGDLLNETNETFLVNLSGATNAGISDNQGQGTINNDDAQPSLSINDVSLIEGNAGTSTANFTVTLSAASGQAVSVDYATANGTATSGSDYVAASGTLNFTAGQLTQPVSVTINGDLTNESSETFFVNLTNPANATISDNQGLGTITDDDSQPTLSINDVSVTEGNAGTVNATFTVTLSLSSGQTVTVQYATANGTAGAADYSSTSGPLTFTPGQTTQPVTVAVNGDTLNEANETFLVNLSTAVNATIGDAQGVGTINNDDAQPSLSINDVSVSEGNAGTSTATFTVGLSQASGQSISINYATADGTATSGQDYVSANGTLIFAPGDVSKTIPITINGDTGFETDETYFVNLSAASNVTVVDGQGLGTIVNDDDASAALEFTAANFNQPESNQSVIVAVKRTGNPSTAVTVDFQTNDNLSLVGCSVVSGLASQRCDYLLTSGTLRFAAGEVQKTFRVLTYDDLYEEGNEIINLSLSNPTGGAQLGVQTAATITIQDNDSGAPGTNPIDGAQFFVRQHYADFLQRLPDQAGETYWTGIITSCGTNQSCIDSNRITVSDAFFFEPEYQQTAAYVVRLYRIAFGNDQPFRNPDSSDLTEAKKIPNYSVFVKDRARVVGGSNLAQSQLDLANAFVLRPEFLTKYPGSLTGPQFVDAALATINNDLGVNMSSQRDGLIALFNSGGRGLVMYRLADDNASGNPIDNRALIDAEYNRTFVFTEYAGYLRRNADIGGFKFWLGQVNAFPVRNVNVQHSMVCSFITSTEYQQRFSSFVTHSNTGCQ